MKNTVRSMKSSGFTMVILCLASMLFLADPACARMAEASAQIPVRCSGEDTGQDHMILLELPDPSHLSSQKKKLSLKNGQGGNFTVKADYPGNYRFLVRQDGEKDDPCWDRTVYEGEIIVTEDEEGVMSTQVCLSKKGGTGKENSAEFLNKTKEKETEKPKPHEEKKPPHEEETVTETPVHDQTVPAPQGEVRTGVSSPIGTYTVLLLIASAVIAVSIRIYAERKKHG